MPRLLIRLLNLSLVLLLLTAIWAGWYVSHRGFGQKWRKKVAEEFAARGVYLSVRRLTLDPLRGLMAQDVKIYRDAGTKKQVARIDQLTLDINYTRLLQKLPFINAITIRDGEVELPLDPRAPNGRQLRVAKLQATLYFPPDRLEVRRLEGEIVGVQVELSGTLQHPEALRLTKQNASVFDKDAKQKDQLFEQLAEVRSSGAQPRLEVRFAGDLADLNSLRIDRARLTAERLDWRGCDAQDLVAEATFADGRAALQRLQWHDERGESLLTGSREKDGSFFLQVQAASDWPALLRQIKPGSFWNDLLLEGRREVRGEVSYATDRSPKMLLLGSLDFGRFTYRGVVFDGVQGSYSGDGAQWMVRNLKIGQSSGTVEGEFLGVPGKFNARLVSNVNPLVLLPALTATLPHEARELRFFSPPHAELEISGTGGDPMSWTTTGHLSLGRTTFRGYPLNSARADLRLMGNALDLQNLQVEREEGRAEGAFSWNGTTQIVRLEQISSTLDPVAVCSWISPKLGQIVTPYRFHQSPQIEAHGEVHVKSPTGTDLSLQISAPQGMNYLFLKKDLPFDSVSGHLTIKDQTLEIQNLQATIFGGQAAGTVQVSLAPADQTYGTAIHLEGVSFPRLTDLYFGYRGSSGLLSGEGEFHGIGLDPRRLTGSGKLLVKDGEVFEIPVFGPFSKTLDHFMPGLGYSRARRASGSFTMNDGLIKTSDFLIAGRGVSMFGKGHMAFLDDSMDFNMRINANGLTGALLDPVSRFFEFHTDGPLKKPLWKPRNFPLPAGKPEPLPTAGRNSPVAYP